MGSLMSHSSGFLNNNIPTINWLHCIPSTHHLTQPRLLVNRLRLRMEDVKKTMESNVHAFSRLSENSLKSQFSWETSRSFATTSRLDPCLHQESTNCGVVSPRMRYPYPGNRVTPLKAMSDSYLQKEVTKHQFWGSKCSFSGVDIYIIS